MPSRKIHNLIATKVFGLPLKLSDRVNADVDAPSRWLGPGHRKLRHNDAYALAEGVRYGDPQAFFAVKLHVWLDETASRDPAFRKWLKVMDILY